MPQTVPDCTVPSIRHAQPSDAPALIDMIGQLARHHGDTPQTTLALLKRDLFAQTPWVTTLVADQAGALLGYAILCRVYSAQQGERGLDLHHLFVVEQARKSGLGRRLVAAAIEQARTCSCTYLVVGTHPSNLDAQRFYVTLGFDQSNQAKPRFRISL